MRRFHIEPRQNWDSVFRKRGICNVTGELVYATQLISILLCQQILRVGDSICPQKNFFLLVSYTPSQVDIS